MRILQRIDTYKVQTGHLAVTFNARTPYFMVLIIYTTPKMKHY